jgi:lipopolysaccharide/colanic/teichoic acid biosynthesis glycosyltransferase
MINYDQVKRLCDIATASVLLLLLTPIFLIIMLLVSADGHTPFYAHGRVGKQGKKFACLKFRSMKPHSDQVLATHLQENPLAAQEWAETRKLKLDPRVTLMGKFLRSTSLDELPQLWNVVCGDMAIVGPRPVTSSELALYYHFYADCYTSVRPGITGLWQVSGRSTTSYHQRVMLDVRYAHTHDWKMDATILWKTPRAVLMGSGAY